MRVHCIQHSENVVPANVATWTEARGHQLEVVRLFEGDELPPVGDVELAVVLGGPMSVHDVDEHPWLVPEKAWLGRLVDARVPVLGICLGSQLLAEVLGGDVTLAEEREIGFTQIARLPAAAESAVFRSLPDAFETFSWHSDTWSVPPGARLVARSDGCERQAFEWGGCVYALQFHPEFSYESTHHTVTVEGRVVEPGKWVQQPDEFLADPERFEPISHVLYDLLDAIVRVHAPAPHG